MRKIFASLFSLLVLIVSLGAIPADTVWEVRPSGSDTLCGGGFSAANKGATGVDYTVQDAAQYTYTANLSAVGTTTLTGVGFTNDILGNVFLITGQGSYCVTAFTNSTTVTVDRALGTFSGATGYIGGGFATPGKASGVMVASNALFIKGSNTYSCSTTANVAGGRISMTNFASNAFVGYITNRTFFNTDTPRPILKPAANSVTVFTSSGAGGCVSNIEFANPDARTTCNAIDYTGGGRVALTNLKASGFVNAINTGTISQVLQCDVSGSGIGITAGAGSMVFGCSVHDGDGVNLGSTGGGASGAVIANTLIYNITGTHGLSLGSSCTAINVSVYNVTGATNAINFGSTNDGASCYNCIVTDSQHAVTAYGFDGTNGANTNQQMRLVNCAGYNNRTANYNTATFTSGLVVGFVTLSASPWTTPGSDFSLNSTTGGGALCRATGILGALPAGGTSYQDLGAIQHADPAGSGGKKVGPGGGKVGMLDPRSLFPFPRSQQVITRKAG